MTVVGQNEETAQEEEEWQELPVNKLTKMLKLVKETEKKQTKQEKWAKAAKDNFWRKELRKVSKVLVTEGEELRLVEGSTIYLSCEERELTIDEERHEATRFFWLRNGVVLEEESIIDMTRINFTTPQRMTIYPAEPGDSGRYACYYDAGVAGQITLEILPVASAIWEGFKIAGIMVISTVPAYLILILANRSKVEAFEEIIQEKEEKDLDLDDRVDQIILVLEKDNEDLKTKRRRVVPEEPEEEITVAYSPRLCVNQS